MRHLLALLSIFTFLTSSTLHAQVPSYVPTNGLVAWYPFNANANDESGNGNDLTTSSIFPSPTLDRFGFMNSAYRFYPGNNLFKDTPNTLGQNFTWSLWMNKRNIDIESVGIAETDSFSTSGGGFGTSFNIPKFICQGYTVNVTNSNTSIQNDEWIHFVIIKSGNTFSIYIDAIINSSGTSPYATYNTNTYFQVGQNSTGTADGDIDDIGMWNRVLTPAEIQALYNAPPPTPCVSPTAVSFSGLSTSYNTSDGAATLTGTPAGGVFIGPGVTGSTFSPAVAGEGTHGIIYTYVDDNGCVNSYSLCTSVSLGMGLDPGGNAPGGVRVFPNPNRGQFTVELELTGLVGMQVFDARGALVHNEVFTASGSRTQRTLDLSAFAKGSYTLLVEHDGQRVSQTVVVE
jgi:hypothetical protein